MPLMLVPPKELRKTRKLDKIRNHVFYSEKNRKNVFKYGNKAHITNYRLMSIISNFSKAFEVRVANQIY